MGNELFTPTFPVNHQSDDSLLTTDEINMLKKLFPTRYDVFASSNYPSFAKNFLNSINNEKEFINLIENITRKHGYALKKFLSFFNDDLYSMFTTLLEFL